MKKSKTCLIKVFIILQLKHIFTKKRLTIICVHLKANENFSELRKQQTEYMMKILKEHMSEKDLKDQPLLLCGDFNGERIEEFYDLIVQDKSFDLCDAYDRKLALPNSNGNNSNFKRPKYVDYIFYSKSTLRLLSVLNEDRRNLYFTLPCLRYPSDHLSLVCDFQFVYTNK
jgi:nocturnin